MERMFGIEYVQGYTAALMDVRETLQHIDWDIKHHKLKRTAKEYNRVLDCMIKNRVILREEPNAFVRYNTSLKDWEVYIGKR